MGYKEFQTLKKELLEINEQPECVDIATLVIADIEARAELGERKYGGRLEVGSRNNMISPLQNAYEEALDLAMYLKQEIEEGKIG